MKKVEGLKTYGLVILGIAYLAGGSQGWWEVNNEVLGALGLGGLATLRHGVSKQKPTP